MARVVGEKLWSRCGWSEVLSSIEKKAVRQKDIEYKPGIGTV